MFAAAFGIRVYEIKLLPLEFHPVRQYHAAFIARALYYDSLKSVPDWERQVADRNRQREGTLEPPIMEHMAALAYRAGGKERLWIPRLLSSIFWLVGGAFLYLLCRGLGSENAAIFSTAFYLFLPYGVLASRSFQPDPLMVMMLLASLHLIRRYWDSPSVRKLAITIIVSALAILVRPVCLFLVLGAFCSVAIWKKGFWQAITSRESWTFVVTIVGPTVIVYLYIMSQSSHLRYQADSSFLPRLLLRQFYWVGWLDMVERVVGPTFFVVALLGILLFREGLPRALVAGLWIGYVVFGLIFNYHIHTHDYYQLQLIPLVAISLGPFCAMVISRLAGEAGARLSRQAALGGILTAFLVVTTASYFQAIWGPLNEVDRDQVTIAEKIGQLVGHTTKALFLSYAYGELLEYHGELYGIEWPWNSDMQAERMRGHRVPPVEERFRDFEANYSPQYFIVTQMDEFKQQPELRDLLTKRFRLLARDDRYLIFDLRQRLPTNPPAGFDFKNRMMSWER